MSRTLAIANVKGGVGKTTTAVNLASALLEHGNRVLAVDLDPQSSLTVSLGFSPDSLVRTIRDVLDGADIHTAILTTNEGWQLIASNEKLGGLETGADREQMFALTTALIGVKSLYDFILLDCPASTGVLTGMALLAADEVVIPLTPDFLSFRAMSSLMRVIRALRERFNPNLRIAGLFLTMYESRTRHARDILTAVHNTYKGEIPFFSAIVHQSVRVKEAPVVGQSVLKFAPRSQAAQAYRQIAAELEQGLAQPVDETRKLSETSQVLTDEPVPAIVQLVSGQREETPRAREKFNLNASLESARRALGEDTRGKSATLVPTVVGAEAPAQPGWSGTEWGENVSPEDLQVEAALQNASAESIPQLLESGRRLAKTGQRQRAARVFARITELDPRHAAAWLDRANTSASPYEKIRFIQRSLDIAPDDPSAKSALITAREELRTGAVRVVRETKRRITAGKPEDARELFNEPVGFGPRSLSPRRLVFAGAALCLALLVLLLVLLPRLPRP